MFDAAGLVKIPKDTVSSDVIAMKTEMLQRVRDLLELAQERQEQVHAAGKYLESSHLFARIDALNDVLEVLS